jgi:regulator of replication initiation timing
MSNGNVTNGFKDKLKKLGTSRLKPLFVLLLVLTAGLLAFVVGNKAGFKPAHLINAISFGNFFQSYREVFSQIGNKMEAISVADRENESLTLENANLRNKLEKLQFECNTEKAEKFTKNFESKFDQQTGSKVGRTLTTIQYKMPTHLMPTQLYTLAVSYFKAREDEKSAVIMSYLTDPENDQEIFRTPQNHLMTAVAWYRLENFELADFYLDKVVKTAESPENVQYIAQSRLWKAIVAKRLKQPAKSQFWLRELVDYHPFSTEASWINTWGHTAKKNEAKKSGQPFKEEQREPASEE